MAHAFRRVGQQRRVRGGVEKHRERVRFDSRAADCSMAYRSTGKNRPLSLKPTLPRVLSRANASVVDEE